MTNQSREEVAVFVDLENLRYSMLNLHGVEPDFNGLIEKIRTYGRPSVMRAYADFSEHPDSVRRQLQIVGIEAINVPVKRISRPSEFNLVERIKNAADMWFALDAISEASDADAAGVSKTFVLVTGDADYIKLVTQLRNRYGQRVIVCGVPGSTSNDLVSAANEIDPIEVPSILAAEDSEVRQAIVRMAKRGPSPMQFWTMRTLDSWSQDERNGVPGTPTQRRNMLRVLSEEGVFLQVQREYIHRSGELRQATAVELDEDRAIDLGYLPDYE